MVRFIFQLKGEGTRLLATRNAGEEIDILGPLGSPFEVEENISNAVIVGGGIGVFPLLMLAKALPKCNLTGFMGFRNKELVSLEEEFTEICDELKIATDDGSYGHHGYVTQLMVQKFGQEKVDIVYACGPEPMLKSVQRICQEYDIPCQLSLEQRMGCGIGACLVCACKIKAQGGGAEYKHVCKDGPVFLGSEVDFDE